MRIIHITDSHGTMKSPSARQDVYFVSFLEKMMEIAYRVRQFNADMVIHTGDLFHTSRVSDKFTGMLAEIIRRFGVPMYVVPGNHDIDGYNLDTIDQTKLGLLYKTGVVRELDREHPLEITTPEGNVIHISGQEYYAGIDEGNMNDFSMQNNSNSDLNILCIHSYIVNEQQPAEIKCTQASSIVTDADIILSGHFHRAVLYESDDFAVYNPGSMMRVEQTEYNKTHMPQFGLLDITYDKNDGLQYEYTYHQFKCAKPVNQIFNYNAKYIAKTHSITLEGFKNSIANTMSSVRQSNFSTTAIIDQVCNNNPDITQDQHNAIKQFYSEVFQSMPEEYVTRKGYVEYNGMKTISKVEIMNFQSHVHTVIDFDNGMNIIEGESNAGKTAIFRAIMWCIDNKPLGSDFITANANTCSVEITFSDGSKIKRYKTRKESGAYQITDPSGNQTEYKGFTNNVPIEVDNVHQMPVVQISKDISTHLNVMMQLDQPFMITDSPQNRAQAIGRITGVHVVDAVIKQANSKMLANNKQIKALNKSLEAHKKDLDSRPDLNVVMNAIQNINKIIYYIKAQSGMIDSVIQKVNEVNALAGQIVLEENNIKKYSKISEFNQYVLVDIGIKIAAYNKISYSYDSYNEVENKISYWNDSQYKCSKVSSLLPLLYKTLKDISVINKISEINTYDNQLKNEQYVHDSLVMFITRYDKISKYIDMLMKQVMSIDNMCNELSNINTNETVELQNIEKYQKLIDNSNNDMYNIVMSSKTCPCCGQNITSDSCNHILQFMTGGK